MSTNVWPREPASGERLGAAEIRRQPEDFRVEELPSWQPSGDGEHDVLWVEKREANTQWVADRLARFADVRRGAVSYAGLKDRFAVTRQWFSVHLPGRQVDWSALQDAAFDVLQVARHHRKLRIGTLAGNRFRIRLFHAAITPQALDERIARLREHGCPNYFGPQRFGHDGANLRLAEALANGRRLPRHKRGFALSAARAQIFNAVLEQRVLASTWARNIDGDVAMMEGSNAVFATADESADTLVQRFADHDIHPTGPLWGDGKPMTAGTAAALEHEVADTLPVLTAALVNARMAQARRSLRVTLADLEREPVSDQISDLCFSLPPGSYATAVLNEVAELNGVGSPA
ncbi:MAG: tRNA pseudouridine(13) synthase TruD [Pseudomonadota bacterium]